MQEAMEVNRESLLSSVGSLVFSQDSSLLSDYLQHHPQKGGKRLIHRSSPLILSPTKCLFTASTQREETEASEPSWFSSLKETSSSANSIPGHSFTTVKESSESLIARECSSQTLSELDYNRGDSDFMYRTTLSSMSCIDSIDCNESGAEATTKINTSGRGLNYRRLSCESKEGDALVDDVGRVCMNNGQLSDTLDHRSPMHNMVSVNAKVSVDSKKASDLADLSKNLMPSDYSVSLNSMTGFDLLLNAALQLHNHDVQTSGAFLTHAKKTDNAGNPCDPKTRYACPFQLNSPILKKRAVRHARRDFSKHTGRDLLHRLGISSQASHPTKKPVSVPEKDENCVNTVKETHIQQQRYAIQYVRRKTLKTLATATSCSAHVLDDGSKIEQDKEVLQTALADICKQKGKGIQIKEKQCKLKQQKNKHGLPTTELVCPALKPPGNAMKLEFDENYQDAISKEKSASVPDSVDCASKEKSASVSDRVDCASKETILKANAETVACIKFGGSGIRLKFRPISLPNKAQMEAHELKAIEQETTDSRIMKKRERLHIAKHAKVSNSTAQSTKGTISYPSDNQQPQAEIGTWLTGPTILLSQESNKLETSGHVPQGNSITRKGGQLLVEEHSGEQCSNIKLMKVMQCDSSSSPTQSNPLIRSKRGRSQALPSKFSDSVLQPWKRAYRKKC